MSVTMEEPLTIFLTDGAIRNGYISLPKNQTFFPPECVEHESRPAPRLFSLILPDGSIEETKVLAKYGRMQKRFNALFTRSRLKEGDSILLTQQDSYSYQMQFLRQNDIPAKTTPKELNSNLSPEPEMKTLPLNQILFGPPGTGKTYHTIVVAQ